MSAIDRGAVRAMGPGSISAEMTRDLNADGRLIDRAASPNNRLKQTARGRSGAESLRRTRAAA